MGFLKRLFGGEGDQPARGAGQERGPSANADAGDDGGAARITVGTCPECQRALRTRERAVRPVMSLTCRCGWRGKVDTQSRTIVGDGAPRRPAREEPPGSDVHSRAADAESSTDRDGAPDGVDELLDRAAEAGVLVIAKSQVLDNDLSGVDRRVDDLIARITADRSTTVHIGLAGYETDSRALFTIPEVRAWCTELIGRSRVVPFLDEETLSWCVPAISPIEIVDADKNSTKFRWSAEACVRQFCVVGFLAAFRVTPDQVVLRALLEQFTNRLQAVAGRFGTTLVLDAELLARIKAASNQ